MLRVANSYPVTPNPKTHLPQSRFQDGRCYWDVLPIWDGSSCIFRRRLSFPAPLASTSSSRQSGKPAAEQPRSQPQKPMLEIPKNFMRIWNQLGKMAGSMVSQKSPQVRLAAIASTSHLQNVLSATALSWPELTAVNPTQFGAFGVNFWSPTPAIFG